MPWRLRPIAVPLALLACSPKPAERTVSVDSLVAPGESLYVRGSYDSATAVWTEALQGPGIAGSAGEARLLHWLGLAAYRRGEYADARRLGERSLGLKRDLRLPSPEIAESQNALGLLAWNEGRLQDAEALLGQALAGFEGGGDRAGVAK
ncbi:MAG TPA: tetratricopeptide repeat protein, partial [Gemmatimonadales bacterium]|nr:tetratricopeptide repeat protein [Gemmatimonadales bacterium]